MKICENCGKEHEGTYGSGRFCSTKCSRGFSTKANRIDINKKIKIKLIKNPQEAIQKICPVCETLFYVFWKKRNQLYCSKSCSIKKRGGWKIVENFTHEQWSAINKKSYENGHNFVSGGTTKWFNYKGTKVQGSYELRTCKILDEWKRIGKIRNWEYTTDRIQYIGLDDKIHSYLLDFKVFLDDKFYYIEVKGYKKPNDELKWQAVKNSGNTLVVWFGEDIAKLENGSGFESPIARNRR